MIACPFLATSVHPAGAEQCGLAAAGATEHASSIATKTIDFWRTRTLFKRLSDYEVPTIHRPDVPETTSGAAFSVMIGAEGRQVAATHLSHDDRPQNAHVVAARRAERVGADHGVWFS